MVNPRPRLPKISGQAVIPQPSVTSKAIAVLFAFDQEHPKLGLTELASRAGLPIATTHRIASELVHSKALVKHGKFFLISSEMWRIGLLAPVRESIAEIAAPYMQDVLFLTQNVVNLFVQDGSSALLVERISGTSTGLPFSRVGTRMSLHSTAAGKVILAYGESSTLESLLFPLEPHTIHTITDQVALRREIAQVRARGFASTHQESAPANFGLAVPILLPNGTLVGTLGVVTLNTPAPSGTTVPVLRLAARSISRHLSRSVNEVVGERVDELIFH